MFIILPFVIFLCVAGGMAAPTRMARRSTEMANNNGTIELLHNETSHSYTMLITFDPDDYTNTYGMAELAYSADSDLYILLNFHVTGNTPAGGNTTFYTIHSDVVNASTPVPVFDPLTNVTIINVAPQYYPDHELALFSVDVNGQPAYAGEYSSTKEVLEGYNFEADLSQKLNVTGVFRAVNGNIVD